LTDYNVYEEYETADRKNSVERDNRNTFKDFQQTLLNMTDDLESQLTSYKVSQLSFAESLTGRLNQFVESKSADLEDSVRFIDQRLQLLEKERQQMDELNIGRRNADNEFFESMNFVRIEFQQLLEQKFAQMQQGALAMVQSIQNDLAKHRSEVRAHIRVLCIIHFFRVCNNFSSDAHKTISARFIRNTKRLIVK
jgi:hypothetical protein